MGGRGVRKPACSARWGQCAEAHARPGEGPGLWTATSHVDGAADTVPRSYWLSRPFWEREARRYRPWPPARRPIRWCCRRRRGSCRAPPRSSTRERPASSSRRRTTTASGGSTTPPALPRCSLSGPRRRPSTTSTTGISGTARTTSRGTSATGLTPSPCTRRPRCPMCRFSSVQEVRAPRAVPTRKVIADGRNQDRRERQDSAQQGDGRGSAGAAVTVGSGRQNHRSTFPSTEAHGVGPVCGRPVPH